MTRRPRGLSPEDEAVWAQVARTVRPIRRRAPDAAITTTSVVASPAASLPAVGVQAPTDTPKPPLVVDWAGRRAVPSSAPRLTLVRASADPAPHDRGGERKVRRGQVDVDAKLDLHGFTQDQAFSALTHFLYRLHAEGAGVALVVTGKGGRAAAGESAPGVLKRRLPGWLASPGLRPIVTGMAGAHRRHGGAGAVYVFLRRQKTTP